LNDWQTLAGVLVFFFSSHLGFDNPTFYPPKMLVREDRNFRAEIRSNYLEKDAKAEFSDRTEPAMLPHFKAFTLLRGQPMRDDLLIWYSIN